jgi:hypothetical protein
MTLKPPRSIEGPVKRILQMGTLGVVYKLLPLLASPSSLLRYQDYRLPTVLGRIGLSTSIASASLLLPAGIFAIGSTAAWFLLRRLYSGPGEYSDPSQSVDSKVDVAVLGRRHLGQVNEGFDAEGLIGSLLTTPLTALAGHYTQQALSHYRPFATSDPLTATLQWSGLSVLSVFLGRAAASILTFLTGVPSSKPYWTPTFVVQTGFTSLAGYASVEAFYQLTAASTRLPILHSALELVLFRSRVIGERSLLFYMLHEPALALLLNTFKLPRSQRTPWDAFLTQLQRFLPPQVAGIARSLIWALIVAEVTCRL